MTVPGELVVALLTASPLTAVAAYLLLFGLPRLQHSKFRHQLWAVRDAIVDDIINGRLSMSSEVKELLLRLHLAVEYAPEHTLRSGLTSSLLLRDQDVPNLRKSLAKARLPRAERELLLSHYDAMRLATVEHLIKGSPSGRLLWSAARFAPISVVGRKRRVGATETAEKELAVLPPLCPDSQGLSARELAVCS